MPSAVKFKQTSVGRQAGERARLKVVQGPDYGSVYVITGSKASIGRGEDNDVVLSDLKASRRHAEVLLTVAGAAGGKDWRVRDLASANGILLNGNAAREGALKTSDTITLGETTLEFIVSLEADTRVLLSSPRPAQQIQLDQGAFDQQRDRVKALANLGGGAKASRARTRPAAQGLQNPLILLLVLGGLAVVVFSRDEEEKKRRSAKKPVAGQTERDLASLLPPDTEGANPELSATARTAEAFFKEGFREFRERNYLRARLQFETVLQIAPGHPQAMRYLEKCKREIEDEVKEHLVIGGRSLQSGKLREARSHFEVVTRLLYRDQSNPAYIEASEQLKKVMKSIASSGGGA